MFWAFDRLQNAAVQFSARGGEARMRLSWLELEREIEAEQLEISARVRAAADSGTGDDAVTLVNAFMADCVERVMERIEVWCGELS